MERKSKSPVWKVFIKDAAHKRTICTLCGKEFKYRCTITNLHGHLKSYHPEWLPDCGMNSTASEQQVVPYASTKTRSINVGVNESLDVSTAEDGEPTTNIKSVVWQVFVKRSHPEWCPEPRQNFGESGEKIESDEAEHDEIETRRSSTSPITVNVKSKIDKGICLDFQNLTIVEDSGFSKLPGIYEILCKYMRQELNKCKYVSISAELWTNLNMEAFITLTVHYFSDDEYTSFVLQTERIHNVRSSEDLASVMHRIFDHWHIFEKITAIVAFDDDALKAACSMLNITHLPCIAQLLNATMTEVLTQNDAAQILLQRCQNLVAHFKMNSASDVLHDKQIKLARWNSALHMFQRLVEMKEPLSTTFFAVPQCPEPLTTADWLNLDDFITVLKPFELMTSELSADYYCNISKVEPLMRGVQYILHNVTCTTDLGTALKKSLLEKLNDRFSTYEKYIIPPVATLLDPRFKNAGFGYMEAIMESTFNFVVEQLSELKSTKNSGNENLREHENGKPGNACSDFWKLVHKRVSEFSCQKARSKSAEMLVTQYLDLPYLERHDCPFKFWIRQSNVEPELADIAMKFMCIPATSFPANRLYSKIGINE